MDDAARAAFLEFWQEARITLLRTCKSVASGNQSDAEDLLATAACRAWEQFKRQPFDTRSGIAWCRAVVRNLAADGHRARSRHPHDDLDDLDAASAALCSDPERDAIARRLLREVAVHLGRLPVAQRTALELRCVDGESYSGVASGLRTTELNARKLVQLARRTLRESQSGRRLHVRGEALEPATPKPVMGARRARGQRPFGLAGRSWAQAEGVSSNERSFS